MDEVGMLGKKLGSSRDGRPPGCIHGSRCGCLDGADVSMSVSPKCPGRLVFGGQLARSWWMSRGLWDTVAGLC